MTRYDMDGVVSEWYYLVNEKCKVVHKSSVDYEKFQINSEISIDDRCNFLDFISDVVKFMTYGMGSKVDCNVVLIKGEMSKIVISYDVKSLGFCINICWL